MSNDLVVPSSGSVVVDSVSTLESFLPSVGSGSLFSKKLVEFFVSRQDVYKSPPSFVQLCADFNQFAGQGVSQVTLNRYLSAVDRCEVAESDLVKFKRKHKSCLDDPDVVKDLKRLENAARFAENLVSQRFDSWQKTWKFVRDFEEKRIDRETPKELTVNTVHSVNPQQMGLFLKQNRAELDRLNSVVDIDEDD